MLKIENTEVLGWEHAIRGMRNPLNSWGRSDSKNNIITLCGSSKFKNEFLKVQKELSLKGYLVLSLGLFGHSGDDEAWEKKDLLDRVHKQKIDMSSAIFVIDVNGYIGESTKQEIEHAIDQGKPVYFYNRNDLEAVQEITNGSCIGPNDLDLMTTLRNAGTDHRKFMRMVTVYMDITAPLYWWKEFDTYKVGTVANSCSTMHKIAEKEFTIDDFSCEHLFDPDDMLKWNERKDIAKDNALAAVNVDGDWCYFTPKGYIQMTCNILNHYRQKYLEAQKKPMKEEVKRTGLVKQYWWQMIQLLPSSYNQKRTVMLNYEVLANMYKSRRNHKLDEWHTFCDWIEGLPYSELITGIDWKKANPILHAERDENGNLLREMKKAIDPAERVSDTSKAMTNIMDKLIASRGKRSEIPGIVDDNIGCNEGLNKHFGGCEE